jgi:hypothetical protein
LVTDGEANKPNSQSCKYAAQAAAQAQASGITIATNGPGVQSAYCADSSTSLPSPYVNTAVMQLLAAMASPIGGVPASNNLYRRRKPRLRQLPL